MKVGQKQQEHQVETRIQDETREAKKKQHTPQAGDASATHKPEANKDWQKYSHTEEKVSAPGVKKHEDKRVAEEAQGQISAAELLRQHQQKNNGIPS